MKLLLKQIQENPVALREAKVNDPKFQSLKADVKANGVLMPVLVTLALSGDGKTPRTVEDDPSLQLYTLIDGLQRFTVSKELGLTDIPVHVITADDERVKRLQVSANFQRVPTRVKELVGHLNRIMGDNPTRTLAELSNDLNMSVEYLGKILAINDIKSEEVKNLIFSGKINVSNAADLAKLPEEEQENFIREAVDEPSAVFGGKVKSRLKEIRDAKRAGRDPNAHPGFVYEPHLRSKTEVLNELAKPTLALVAKSAGVTTIEDAIAFALRWTTKQDSASIDAAKAKYEEKKAAAEAEKTRKKAERDAQRARESAAAVESLATKT